MLVIAIVNQKGGVGKSMTTSQLAYELAAAGRGVTVIDLDAQGTVTEALVGVQKGTRGVADVLKEEASLAEVVMDAPAYGVRVAAADEIPLRSAYVYIETQAGGAEILKGALRGYEEDVVLLDCPPMLTGIVSSALLACTHIVIPVQTTDESVRGLDQLTTSIGRFQRRFAPQEFPVVGVIPTMYDGRERKHAEHVRLLRERFPTEVCTPIRRNAAIQHVFGQRKPLRVLYPRSSGASDYATVAQEILARV